MAALKSSEKGEHDAPNLHEQGNFDLGPGFERLALSHSSVFLTRARIRQVPLNGEFIQTVFNRAQTGGDIL
jgi:hypothetical protein